MVATPAKSMSHDTLAREYIQELLKGNKPETHSDFGPWNHIIEHVKEAFDQSGGNTEKLETVLTALCYHEHALAVLLTPAGSDSKTSVVFDKQGVPQLPEKCKRNEALADQASPTLDAMIDYFKLWATRSYDGYHESVAVWVLSTIAARRVFLNWRRGVWTPIYVMLVSGTTGHAKTEAAGYGQKVIEDAGLGYLLCPDNFSPQKLINNMAGRSLPRNYSVMTPEQKERTRLRVAFSGQKGWLYDEFGNKIQEIMGGKGYNELLYTLMKQLYDSKRTYEYDTQARGLDHIDMPYLSVVGTATPDCLKPVARKRSAVWTDGFFPRIAFSVPDPDEIKLKNAPPGDASVPPQILQALRSWHERLGIPYCEIIENIQEEGKKGLDTDPYTIERGELPQAPVHMPKEVYEAHELYYASLITIGRDAKLDERYRGNYGRLPDMALRIAMLLASMENNGYIEMKHWARGQAICERWRVDFHKLVKQITSDDTSSYSETEDKVLDALVKLGPGFHKSRDISQAGSTALRTLGSPAVRKILFEMAEEGIIVQQGGGARALFSLKT